MPTDRVLIEIVTAANMAGIKQAQAGFLGMNAATLAAAAGLGALIYLGEQGLKNYKAQEEATKSLTQAFKVAGKNVADYQSQIDDFLKSNARYIDDQYGAQEAIAGFIRAGNDFPTTMHLMNDALDLSAIKHISVADAAHMLLLAENGNTRALRDLGLSSKDVTALLKNTHTEAQRGTAIHQALNSRIQDGRKTTDDLAQSQKELNQNWQNFSSAIGPGVESAEAALFDALNSGLGILQVFVDLVYKLPLILRNAIIAIDQLLGSEVIPIPHINILPRSTGDSTAPPSYKGALAGGGFAYPGGIYTVGEAGPETLVMGSSGGRVIPHGGGGSGMTVNFYGFVGDNRQLVLAIREGLRRLDQEHR